MLNILLFTSDLDLHLTIQTSLSPREFKIISCKKREDAITILCNDIIHLCIIDKESEGVELFKMIKHIDEKIPIVFISDGKSLEDKYKAFEMGCDDYIIKPFYKKELSLRINTIVRRTHLSAVKNLSGYFFPIGTSIVDFEKRSLKNKDKIIWLSRKEATLLKLFCTNKGKLLMREQILNEVWKSSDDKTSKCMDVYLNKLRKKLKHETNIKIQNIHGTGYMLVETKRAKINAGFES